MSKKMFEKAKLGKIEVNNRFVRSALWIAACKGGHLTDDFRDHYYRLAKGGVGAIITGYAYISEDERPNPGMIGISDDRYIPDLKEFTSEVHRLGDSKIILQIAYGGSQCDHPNKEDFRLLAPSAVQNVRRGHTPQEASKKDIAKIVDEFANAALRAKKAGFDGVQLHGAHGYFLSMFMTPYFNQRGDEYGGSVENRTRIFVEVLKAVRQKVGDDFTVGIKINGDDLPGEGQVGMTNQEACELAKILEDNGIDFIEVSGGNESLGYAGPAWGKLNKLEKQNYFYSDAKNIADAVKVPVIMMGGVRNVAQTERLINDSKIEFASMARPLLSEPDLVSKWQKDEELKTKCVSCNKCYSKQTPIMCIFDRKKGA